ncbi:MAG: hypothetical protein JO317_01100, partial [Verrucomicrobiae bacterium]|nr:hypothetical protein [Verrucomicrobiae bacterium]
KVMPWGSLLGSDTNYGMMAYMDDTADSSTIMLFENPVSYGHAYFYATAGQGNQWELDIRNGSTYYLSGVIHYASAYWTDSAPMVHDFPYIDPGAHVAYVDGRVEWQKGPRIKYIRRYPMKHVPGWLWWRDSDDAGIYGIW